MQQEHLWTARPRAATDKDVRPWHCSPCHQLKWVFKIRDFKHRNISKAHRTATVKCLPLKLGESQPLEIVAIIFKRPCKNKLNFSHDDPTNNFSISHCIGFAYASVFAVLFQIRTSRKPQEKSVQRLSLQSVHLCCKTREKPNSQDSPVVGFSLSTCCCLKVGYWVLPVLAIAQGKEDSPERSPLPSLRGWMVLLQCIFISIN